MSSIRRLLRLAAMPRPLRTAPGGFVYHVLNRANGKRRIFEHDRDYLAFERVLAEVQERVPVRILAWCVMPNHWHLLLWPQQDGELSNYMRLVTLTHTQRLHAHRASAGTGHVYQGRFKSFVVQHDSHFLAVSRYVEANALSGKLVQRAEDWRWGSLWHVQRGKSDQAPGLHPWPITRPGDWLSYVNRPAEAAEADGLRRCARRGSPFGDEAWAASVAEQLGLQSTLRPRGRPAKEEGDS
ncbi:MAG TPA: transposase [Burkholderiales bacterium]|nr:transposase [Burkholderiales bacterium]